MNQLRNLGDSLKEKLGEGLVFIASTKDGKVSIVAMATDAAVKAGVSAGNVIKAVAGLVGGKGGGRPNMAQAGGTNADGIKECLEAVYAEAEKQIKLF
jgi:alanyl-tRNA synthetase